MGTRHHGRLLTHVERKSLFTIISKLSRPTAQATPRATVHRLKPLRRHVHTITYDNGKEFARHRNTAQCLQAHVFFATPYHAWERGVNENTNGLIRDFFPKARISLQSINDRGQGGRSSIGAQITRLSNAPGSFTRWRSGAEATLES